MAKHELHFITAFRALAALWVLASHCMIWGGWHPLPLPNAKLAVDLFMMLSGFLMAANADARWRLEPLTDGGARLRFWVRRYFRIAPAYYLALALAVVTSAHFLEGYLHLQALKQPAWIGAELDNSPESHDFSLWNILMHLTFAFGLSPRASSSTLLPDWSLALEMQFYLTFPLIYLLARRAGYVAMIAGLSAFAIFISDLGSLRSAFADPSLLVFALQYFLAGIACYRLLTAQLTLPYALTLLCVSLAALLYVHWLTDHPFTVGVLFLALCLFGWLERSGTTPGPFVALFRSRAVTFASETSYSVYLFHGFFISGFGLLLKYTPVGALSIQQRTVAMFLFVLPLSYAVAYLVLRWIERPGIDFGKRVLSRIGTESPTLGAPT
jgi:peptidoglycan/LPS O-acetylase OafA/YrhL